ncbi:hypothetical protein [Wolbachia endosymbiont (group B) of Silvanus unidentatus]|uniref:hypothetical protein n=1 Tax=Wolbachia endosymbiont (group B) of Silvanus unidentatus TaxID=3066137 RepID=UPI0033427082
MLTNNNNTPSSAPPPPPPPLPADWGKNWKPAKNNDKNENTLGSTPSETSNSTQLKKGQSKSPVQQSSLNFAENPLFKKKQEEHNVNSETADEGSKNSIHVKNPEIALNHKEEDNASDKTKNDRSNTKQVMPKKPMTEQHNGVHSDSENQKSSVAEQKKATGLKYSIAILLLCTSSTVAGVYTCFIILEVLSSAAVPVSSAVIAFVSALVMLSLAAYLINSHLSAINSEKGVDPGRKQSQDLQKAKGLEHSNTHTSSLSVTLGTSSAPTSPTLKNNANNKFIPSGGGKQQGSGDLMTDLHKTLKKPRKATDGEDDVQQQNNEVCQNQSQDLQKAKGLEHSNTPTPSFPVIPETPIVPPPPPPSLGNNFPSGPAIDALFAEIKQRKNLMSKEKRDEIEKKRLKEQEAKKSSNKGGGQQEKKEDLMADLNKVLLKRRANLHGKQGSNVQQPSNLDGAFSKMLAIIPPPRNRSSSVSSSSSEESEQDWSDNESTYSTPLNPQPDNKKRRDSSDSGHESDDNVKPKSTTPPRSTLKAEKPPISPKPVNSKTKSEASSPTKTNTVELASSEMQESSTVSVQEIRKRFE